MLPIDRIVDRFLFLFAFFIFPEHDECSPTFRMNRFSLGWDFGPSFVPWGGKSYSKSWTPRKQQAQQHQQQPQQHSTTYIPRREPQIIASRYIDERKLQEVAHRKFGYNYKLQMRSNTYRLYAPQHLSEQEISFCL
jgi:hypothetical protein